MSNNVISILGCGWLGKPLGSALVDAGYVVKGSTTRPENVGAIESAGIQPFIVDVDKLSSENRSSFFDADVLIISLPPRSRAGKAEQYVEQIREVTKVARANNVSKIVLISTTGVYPNLNRVVTEEDADTNNPIVQAERVVQNSGMSNTIVRFGGLFGPGRDPGKFLAGKQDVAGGDVPVNMIHLDDCVGIITSIIQQEKWNEVLNACADEHPTKKEFYSKAAVELGLEAPSFSDEESDFKIVSNERLKKMLNYRFSQRLS